MPRILIPMQRAHHGANFRAFGLRGAASAINPFIGVDHAWMSAPTFAPHPHAGFSAVSYLFLDSETGIANRDSTGTNNVILPGGLHWVAAGQGVVHEEVPAEPGRTVHALQIFVALPDAQRASAPHSMGVAPGDVPVATALGAKVRVAAGRFGESRSPLRPPTDVNILDISLEQDAELAVPVEAGQAAFVMPVAGTTSIDDQALSPEDLRTALYPAQGTATTVRLRATRGPAKVMVFSGTPFTH
ncbi:MAG: pirin family protein [Burkholderiaceae bacterium]|nr:pirin family protein [Burkholderiaceae bacterium]